MGKIMLNGKRYCGGLVTPGQGYTEVVLWEDSSGASPSSAVTLSSAISNFDAIYIITASNAEPNYRNSQIIPISAIDKTGATNFGVFDTGANTYYYVVLNYVDDTHLTLGTWGSSYPIKYYKIVGIKYAVGGNVTQPAIYSTEEREIGVWTDGKPLYQKTWVFSSTITLASNTWVSIPNVSISNLDRGVRTICGYNHGEHNCIISDLNSSPIELYNTRSSAIAIDTITAQYTKTTDTAGSGLWTPQGTPAQHYATYEQVVGTWIDGSTLYEKTVSFTAPSNNYNTFSSNITNFNKCISYTGIVMMSSGIFEDINYNRPDSNNSTYYTAITANGDVFFRTYESTNATVYVTIRYTKTS